MINTALEIKKLLEDLLPEEQEEVCIQIQGLPLKEAKKAIRKYKLSLDLPELTEEEREPIPVRFFEEANTIAIMLIDATEEISSLNYRKLHPNAKDLLLSQMKKTIGRLARIVSENEKR